MEMLIPEASTKSAPKQSRAVFMNIRFIFTFFKLSFKGSDSVTGLNKGPYRGQPVI